MYADFIAEFRQICGHKWKITIETSLHCSHNIIRQLSKVVDHWIVDIKAMNPRAYEHYTGKTSDLSSNECTVRKGNDKGSADTRIY